LAAPLARPSVKAIFNGPLDFDLVEPMRETPAKVGEPHGQPPALPVDATDAPQALHSLEALFAASAAHESRPRATRLSRLLFASDEAESLGALSLGDTLRQAFEGPLQREDARNGSLNGSRRASRLHLLTTASPRSRAYRLAQLLGLEQGRDYEGDSELSTLLDSVAGTSDDDEHAHARLKRHNSLTIKLHRFLISLSLN